MTFAEFYQAAVALVPADVYIDVTVEAMRSSRGKNAPRLRWNIYTEKTSHLPDCGCATPEEALAIFRERLAELPPQPISEALEAVGDPAALLARLDDHEERLRAAEGSTTI